MPVFDPNMTADKAAQRLVQAHPEANIASGGQAGYLDATRKSNRRMARREPPELSMMKDYKKQRVHIFNVGPWAHSIPCGSAGVFTIPACPIGTDYVEMTTPLHAIEDELYPDSESTYKRLQEEGRKMANEILGLGMGRNRKDSLIHLGVFIAEGEKPTEAELENARAEVHVKCQEYISEMRRLWDIDRKTAHDVYKPGIHGLAAKVLGLEGEEWMSSKTPKAAEKVTTVKCKGCRTEVEADAPTCFKCGGVVNKEAWIDWRAEQDEILSLAANPAPKKKVN